MHFHRSSIESFGVHDMVSWSLLASRLVGLIGLEVAIRCTNIACSVMVENPMVLSSSFARYLELTLRINF